MPSPEEVQIIHGYRRELSRLVLELEIAISHRNYGEIARIAHLLKAAKLFGFLEISDCARALERGAELRSEEAIVRAQQILVQAVHRALEQSDHRSLEQRLETL
jgi:hypothetical protein